MERESRIFGLLSKEVSRLTAEIRRLRQLVTVAREHVQPEQATCPSCAGTVNRLLDDGPQAAPSELPHAAQDCPVRETEEIASGRTAEASRPYRTAATTRPRLC